MAKNNMSFVNINQQHDYYREVVYEIIAGGMQELSAEHAEDLQDDPELQDALVDIAVDAEETMTNVVWDGVDALLGVST